MKFGNFFQLDRRPKWMLYYFDYNTLKIWLKNTMEQLKAGRLSPQNMEKHFHELIEAEINKVNSFYLKAHSRILGKIDSLRAVLAGTPSSSSSSSSSSTSSSSSSSSSYSSSSYWGKTTTQDVQEAFVGQIEHIDSQLNSLWHFCWINHLAVYKLMKKHDKMTGLLSSPWCMKLAEEKPFYQNSERFGTALVRFSECCQKVRNMVSGRNEEDDARPVNTTGSQSFTRQTVKYWVETRDLMRVKSIVAQHLPLYLFDPKKASRDWALISSVYYDDPANLQLYEGRLKKLEGAIAVRMRTYEGSEQEVFVERKTHHENWAWGETSVKERFSLESDDVFDFATGRYNETDFSERIAAQGLSGGAADRAMKLFKEVDSQFKTFHLAPTLTTEYKRTAYQIPGNAAVRISLDTELTFIREALALDRAAGRWRKAKNEVQPHDVHVFPYAILEVKLETQEGVEPPQWILDLTNGPLVRVVDHFSKYIHGCAVLLPQKVNCFPQWIDWPDLRYYARRPEAPLSLPFEREMKSQRMGKTTPTVPRRRPQERESAVPGPPSDDDDDDNNNAVEDEDMAAMAALADRPDIGQSSRKSTSRKSSSKKTSSRQSSSMKSSPDGVRLRAAGTGQSQATMMPLLSVVSEEPQHTREAPSFFKRLLASSRERERREQDNENGEDGADGGESSSSGCFKCLSVTDRTYQGRPIIPRVKIEPKTYFANERTFLRWMSLCIMLEGIGIALLSIPNFSTPTPQTSFAGVSGSIFVVVSILFMGYALYMHRWRARAIAAASSARFDDVWGPVALFLAIVSAALVNMIIYLNNMSISIHTK